MLATIHACFIHATVLHTLDTYILYTLYTYYIHVLWVIKPLLRFKSQSNKHNPVHRTPSAKKKGFEMLCAAGRSQGIC